MLARYPALVAAAVSGIGTIVAASHPGVPAPLWLGLPVVALGLWLHGRRLRRRRIMSAAPSLFLVAGVVSIFAGAALLRGATDLVAPTNLARWTPGGIPTEARVRARVHSLSGNASGALFVRLDVHAVRVRGRWFETPGVAEIALWPSSDRLLFEAFARLDEGDQILCRGVLEPLPRRRNPYDFDALSFYRDRGVDALFQPERGGLEAIVHRHDGAAYRLQRVRRALRERLLHLLRSSASRQLVPAMLLGDRSLIAPGSREAFRASGLAHLLAISGLHVAVVGMSLYVILGLFLGRTSLSYRPALVVRCCLTLIVLACYAFVSGGSSSVVRSVTMASVLMAGQVVERPAAGWNTLGLAALLMTFAYPDVWFSAGFQLSFAAVGGIFLLVPRNRTSYRMRRRVLPKPVGSALSVSTAVTAATLPVLLFHFGEAALGGLIANLAAIPVASLLLVSGMLCLGMGTLPVVGPSLAAATDVLGDALQALASLSSAHLGILRLPATPGRLHVISLVPVLVLWCNGAGRDVRFLWKSAAVGLLLLTKPIALSGQLRVHVLDVGQGDGIVLSTPSGRAVVVDTGPSGGSGRSIARHLRALGHPRVDLLILSHFHGDHIGGFSALLAEIPVTRLAIPSGTEVQAGSLLTRTTADTTTWPRIQAVQSGDTLSLESALRIQVLGPSSTEEGASGGNDRSAVVKATFGRVSILLTGDIERTSETEIVATYGNFLASDIVKVAHHGSSTSSMISFLNRASAPRPGGVLNSPNMVFNRPRQRIAVISVGRFNRFGHPNREILKRWSRAGFSVSMTAGTGAVLLATDGLELRTETLQRLSDR